MKKWLMPPMLCVVCLAGCQGEWWKPKAAPAPPAEIALSRDENWSRLTPHMQISVSGSGTLADPYVYNVPMDLNLNGHNISVTGWQGMGNLGPGVSAIFHVNGGLRGGGSIDVGSQGRSGGKLEITTTGGVALNSVSTGGPKDEQGGEFSLNAGAPVQLSGYINTSGAAGGGNVKIQCPALSIGAFNACSIYSAGPASEASRWPGLNKATKAGHVVIDCSGPVTLQGSIIAGGSQAGQVVIRNGRGGRCQDVAIGGDVDVASRQTGRGMLYVQADSLRLKGNVLAGGQSAPGGEIDVNCLNDCQIGGYVRTDSTASASGHVRLQGRHIWVQGADKGCSINTHPGSAKQAVAGDGNVLLQCVDTSSARYDPNNPLNGATSSVFVAGKILTGYAGALLRGEVFISAVEVQLGGDVQIGITNERTLEIHYGVGRFGYTHLVEASQRWDGRGEHGVNYGAAVPDFLADVPYAGLGR